MNILHLSTHDLNGGAALAAYRLHQAMLKRPGCKSSMLVLGKKSHDPSVTKLGLGRGVTARVKRRIASSQLSRDHAPYSKALSRVELFSDDRGAWTDSIAEHLQGFEIIQLHWISQFLNYERFFENIPRRVPLVWRLADMNPFTGGCHYDEGCGRFVDKCGACPKLQSQQEHDLSRAIWTRKKAALDKIPSESLHIVALNRWMADQVQRSSLFQRFECSIIPNGVDLDEFHPISQNVAREALGIPTDRQVLAFVAESASNVRKGFHLLCDALQHLKARRNLFLLIVGDAYHVPRLDIPSLRVGFVQAPIFLRQIYSAADLFVIPSLEDNQPNTVLEALACGTPVVGFKAGGIPEMVDQEETGLLVSRANVQELADAILCLLDDKRLGSIMRTKARKRAEAAFSRDRQVGQYLELYSRLLSRLAGTQSDIDEAAKQKIAALASKF